MNDFDHRLQRYPWEERETTTVIYHKEKSVILNASIGEHCTIHAPVWIGNNVRIGNGCKIQAFAFIPDGVTLGENVFIGPNVTFTNDKYPPSDTWTKTLIENNVSIGAGSTILPGLTIGMFARIGAGSVVTKNVPRYQTWLGNPARPIIRNGTSYNDKEHREHRKSKSK